MADAASAWKPVAEGTPSAWTPVKEEPPIGQQPASFGGVLETMGGHAGRAVGAAADWLNPLNLVSLITHPYESTVGASARSLDAAGEARKHGDYGEMALHGLGALPVVGPPGESILRDIGQGNVPELLGHAAAAYLMKKAPEYAPEIKAYGKGAGVAAKAQVRPVLEGADLIHPFRMIPTIWDAIKQTAAGGAKGLEDYNYSQIPKGPAPGYTGGAVPPPPLPDLSPIPSKGLPSGRVPGPIKPATVDLSTPESLIPAVQPSAPAAGSEVVTGLHLPEVPAHYAGEPNPTAAFKNDQAIVAELRKVPGITQDSLTPDMVHEVRKALGQRRLKDADIERRVDHIRKMLPK